MKLNEVCTRVQNFLPANETDHRWAAGLLNRRKSQIKALILGSKMADTKLLNLSPVSRRKDFRLRSDFKLNCQNLSLSLTLAQRPT
jgi:hypothetical protein